MKFIYPVLFFVMATVISCSDTSQPSDPIPEHETFTIKSAQVGEDRVINVWTPEDYKTASDSLPLMYMADGGIKEDFPHIANTLAKLIKEQKIKPLILVGIENMQRRRDLNAKDLYTYTRELAKIFKTENLPNLKWNYSEEPKEEHSTIFRATKEKAIIWSLNVAAN